MNDQTKNTNNQSDDEIDLRELLGTILEGKWLIAFMSLVFIFGAFIYAYGQDPVYKADSLLQVESQKSGIPGIEELAGLEADDASVGTEIEIIKSRKILDKAVKNLRLDIIAYPKRIPLLGNLSKKFYSPNDIQKPPSLWKTLETKIAKYAWGIDSINVHRLDVPQHLLNHKLTLVVRPKNAYEIFYGEQLLHRGIVNLASSSTFDKGTISIFVREINALPGTHFILVKRSSLRAIQALQSTIKASEKGKKTGIINLVIEGKDKQKIVQTLDIISKTYLEQNKSRSSEEASNALKFLDEQIKPVREQTDSAEADLKNYRTSNKTADMSMETQGVLEVVSEIDTELQKLSLKKDELKQKYTDNHPTLQTIRSNVTRLEKRKKEALSKISKLPGKQQRLLKLESDYKVANTIYLDLLNNIQEFKIAKASNVGNVYILDNAVVYDTPIKPKKSMILALGALLGLMLSTLIVFLKKVLDHKVNNPEKVEEELGLPVYATIPLSKNVQISGRTSKNKRQKTLLAAQDSTDPAIESLRSLRTSLHFALLESKNNIVMITGPSPGIGKSFISSNLAAVIAASNQKVLLIDSDMRKGYLHKLFDVPLSPGLSEIISRKQSTLENVIHEISYQDTSFDFLTRGQTPPNPSEILMHPNFEKFLTGLSSRYDIILIDTPPIHAVTDPAIVGSIAGVVFMVLKQDEHSMKEIEHAVKRLSQTGIKTKGFIFNAYDIKKNAYGYGYGYGYQSYYGDYKSDSK